MAGFDMTKMQQAANTMGGIAGLAGSWAGAYYNVPQAKSIQPYMQQAVEVGNIQYKPSDMEGLMSQYNRTPKLQTVTAEDLYNPSAGEVFGSMMGAGMSSYGAASGLTGQLKGKMGSLQFSKNSTTPKGNGSHVDMDLLSGATTSEEKYDIAEKGANPLEASVYRAVSNAAAQQRQDSQQPVVAPYYDNTLDGSPWTKSFGGPLNHLYGIGGSFDVGSMVGTGLNLASAGIGMGIAAAGMVSQRRKAEADAQEYMATKMFVDERTKHNFGLAVQDSKNNMFNMQALQMMAEGGPLQTQGTTFPLNGQFNIIGAGGTHERNPLGGVPQGVAADGQQNLVEEDEVVWNDYVFSNRLRVPKKFGKDFKLKEGMTFADAAKKLAKEAEERPNDPISQNGLADVLGRLRGEQEDVRERREAAAMKRAISKMSPSDVMQLVQLASAAGQQEGQSSQGGEYAFGGHIFSGTKGESKMTRADRRSAEQKIAREKLLFGRRLDQLTTDQLRYIASQITGYDGSKHQTTDAKNTLRKFIEDNYDNIGGYSGVVDRTDRASVLPLLQNLPDPTWTNHQSYSMSDEDWQQFFTGLSNYKESRKPSATQGKYHADSNFSTNGKTAAEVEKDPRYKAFKKYILDQATAYRTGNDADEHIIDYIMELDKGINTDKGVARLLQYDDNGEIARDEHGRVRFSDTFDEDFNHRAYDGIGGINHFYNGVPDITNTRTGERTIYRMRNGSGGWDNVEITAEQLAANPYLRQIGTEDVQEQIDGDDVTTHYINLEGSNFSEDATPEDTPPGKKIPPLPTWPRYAPVVGAFLGSLPQRKEDYSTALAPQQATYKPIGDYLPYLPTDSQRYIGAENQRSAAQLNAIMNATGANRNAALAQAALATSQRQQGISDIMHAAENENWAKRVTRGEFNRGTNQFNAQSFNTAELQNMNAANSFRLNQAQRNAAMRYQVDMAHDAARSESLNALFDSLGAIGRENFYMNQVNSNEALDYGSFFNGLSQFKSKKG